MVIAIRLTLVSPFAFFRFTFHFSFGMTKPQVIFVDTGLIEYKTAWDLQHKLQHELIDRKLKKRDKDIKAVTVSERAVRAEDFLPSEQEQTHHYLLFCEHPPVYTLGKSGSIDNLLLNEEQLAAQGATFFKINRGGDITFHGIGQITGYPILDLDYFFNDVHKYVRSLEEAVIRTCAEFNVIGSRINGYTGVWINDATNENPKLRNRKICAIGVHLSRWVTLHGFAFNVSTDISYFDAIIPCGIEDEDKSVTSLEKEISTKISMNEVKLKLLNHFSDIFKFDYEEKSLQEIENNLALPAN